MLKEISRISETSYKTLNTNYELLIELEHSLYELCEVDPNFCNFLVLETNVRKRRLAP